jgi:hypothetical protein
MIYFALADMAQDTDKAILESHRGAAYWERHRNKSLGTACGD